MHPVIDDDNNNMNLLLEELDRAEHEARTTQEGDYDPLIANERWGDVIDLITHLQMENLVILAMSQNKDSKTLSAWSESSPNNPKKGGEDDNDQTF